MRRRDTAAGKQENNMPQHFVLLQHGVLGNASDFDELLRQIMYVFDGDPYTSRTDQTTTGGGRLLTCDTLTCFATGSNARARSLEGTQRCALRALRECIFPLQDWLNAINRVGPLFSCVGHSFGGIVAREMLFLLFIATEDAEFGGEAGLQKDTLAVRELFRTKQVNCNNFITIATPHCGIAHNLWTPLLTLARCTARASGFTTLSELLLDTTAGSGEGERAKVIDDGPLLKGRLLSCEHRAALKLFFKRTVFGNVRKDICVDFETATLHSRDRFFSGDDSSFSALGALGVQGQVQNAGSSKGNACMESSKAIAVALCSDLEWQVVALCYAGVMPVAHVACIGMLSWCDKAGRTVRRIALEITDTHKCQGE